MGQFNLVIVLVSTHWLKRVTLLSLSSPLPLFSPSRPSPPLSLSLSPQSSEVSSEWTEESAKMCLGLFLSLLPLNHKLLKEYVIVLSQSWDEPHNALFDNVPRMVIVSFFHNSFEHIPIRVNSFYVHCYLAHIGGGKQQAGDNFSLWLSSWSYLTPA